MIDDDVKFGKNVNIFDENLVNIFGCEIGNETFVGPFVEITKGAVIGKKCIIESHSFICNYVKIEDNVFISHGVMFTNDLYPKCNRQGSYRRYYTKTLIKNGVSIGSNSTIVAGITIGKHSIIGAGSVVTKNVPSFSIAVGNPAKVQKQFQSLRALLDYIQNRQ